MYTLVRNPKIVSLWMVPHVSQNTQSRTKKSTTIIVDRRQTTSDWRMLCANISTRLHGYITHFNSLHQNDHQIDIKANEVDAPILDHVSSYFMNVIFMLCKPFGCDCECKRHPKYQIRPFIYNVQVHRGYPLRYYNWTKQSKHINNASDAKHRCDGSVH